MWTRRYPYPEVGRLASIAFALAGLIIGAVVGSRTGGGGGVVITAFLWTVIAAGVSYLVYASQGPQRPDGYQQASAADGVVAGVLIGFVGTVLTLAGLSGLGASSAGGPSLVQGLIAVAVGLLGGGVVGGLWGLALSAVAGESRMTRVPIATKRATKRSSSAKKRKKR